MAFYKTMPPFTLAVFLVTIFIAIAARLRPWPGHLPDELLSLDISAKLRTDTAATALASTDFGRLTEAAPAAVFYPSSVDDVAALVRFSYESPQFFPVAARGHGHSIRGQALAPDGVVVEMRSLDQGDDRRISVFSREEYIDVGGEQLWIDVLHETLKRGLAPRSWTDYLYLTVGGTLSNAGVSGQAFLHGPQISNVYELDVITGKGEMLTCSEKRNSDLFFAVLGGLGQFGIITRARIALEPAPEMVRWVRLIYSDFAAFTRDQEWLISMKKNGFQYVEGSLMMDQGIIGSWRSSFFSGGDLEKIAPLVAQYTTIYCLEGSKYYNLVSSASVEQELNSLLEGLSYEPGFAFTKDVSYLKFLDRVHDGELKLRAKGLWNVPHPWVNIFVPKSRIIDIDVGVFKGILKSNTTMGPILIYPMDKNKWDERTSAVIPDEEVFYTIGLLRLGLHDLENLESQNMEMFHFLEQKGIKFKQYLPHYRTQDEWMKHFGSKWSKFVDMKLKYDPRAILSPGQRIFTSSLVNHV